MVSYLDGNFDAPLLACSIESFYRIPDTRQFECVILDECEAILSIFSCPTLQGRQLIAYNKVKIVIKKVKKQFLQGHLSRRRPWTLWSRFILLAFLLEMTESLSGKIHPRMFNVALIKFL